MPATEEKPTRLTLPLTKDDKIDWDGVRPARRAALRKILSDSGIAATPAGPVIKSTDPIVNAALCSTLYDLIAQLEALAATRILGCSVDQAFKALQFSMAEKTALAEPTIAVLNKYLPASLLDRYADECMLLLLLATMTRAKVTALQDSLARHSPRPVVNMESRKNEAENTEKP